MTMLDRMRYHKAWLKWSLGIVVAAFILLYIPSFLQPAGVGAAPGDTLATIEGHTVTVAAYQRAYQLQVMNLRRSYGETMTDQLLRQLGVSQQVLQQLIDEQAVLAEARRIGIRVSNAELRERLLRIPGFQENGQFIGEARYRQLLQSQRPPMRPAEFETDLRQALVAEKLQNAVTGWIQVTEADVEAEYRRQNEKVKLDLAIFRADQFRAGIDPTDAELTAHFTAHAESYRVPEKRRVRYLSIDAEAVRARVTVTPQEIEARYRENAQAWATPEQLRASHILFKTDGKDEAAVRQQAERVLTRIKGGADFAAMAKQYSEDEANKAMGGDLDYFGRGAMVKEFEDAAWALAPGETSDLVRSPFGFHIIRLTDRRPAATRTLDEVRAQIEDQLRWEKAQAEATRVADEVEEDIGDPSDLDRVAAARGLSVADSGLFTRDEPLAGLGFAPAVAAQAFAMEQGKVSGRLNTSRGFAFITLTEIAPSSLPSFDAVRDRVREDVIRTKAVDVARAKAEAMARAARTNFASAARAAGVEVRTTDLLTRGSALPDIGVNRAVEDAVFALSRGDTTAPIATDNAVVVARVVEREDVDPAKFEEARESLRADLLQRRQGEFFAAYMTRAKNRMQIRYYEDTIRLVLSR